MAANPNTTIDIMLFEGGALTACLHGTTQAQALADKIAQADEAAFTAGQYHFSLELNPIELGMCFEATSDAQSLLAQSLAQKLKDALVAKLQELNINYDGSPKAPEADAPADEQPAPADDQQPSSSDGSDDQDAEGANSL